MTLKYEFSGNDYVSGDSFEHEIDYRQTKRALMDCPRELLYEVCADKLDVVEYKTTYAVNFETCSIYDLVTVITDNDLECEFEESLTEFYYRDAYEQYSDSAEYCADPYRYNGVSQSDFT